MIPEELAEAILRARSAGQVLRAPDDHGLTSDDAYRIQGIVLEPRMKAGGGRGGWKLGYTSAAMRDQMGITQANYGPLSRAMILGDGAEITDGVTQPRVEPEIAAVLACDVPEGASVDEVRECVLQWRLALEVVDSVWEDYRFDWHLNTADGSSAAYVVLGDELPGHDVRRAQVELLRNGESVGTGAADAAMGDPGIALHWLVEQLAERGDALHSGDVVITGGLTRAVELQPGDVVSAVTHGGEPEARAAVQRLESHLHPH